jgi:16S rRNA processing protein RimM
MLEVGRIDRAHGLRGQVLIRLTTNRDERVAPESVLHTGRGEFEVVDSQPHQNRYIVTLRGVTDRSQAEALAGTPLYAEPIEDPDALWVHELIGCQVVDADGVARGIVEALQDNPASDLLVLDTGALVPLTFLVEGPTDGRIVVDTPPGLFDL